VSYLLAHYLTNRFGLLSWKIKDKVRRGCCIDKEGMLLVKAKPKLNQSQT
jgi:hypothetical protein